MDTWADGQTPRTPRYACAFNVSHSVTTRNSAVTEKARRPSVRQVAMISLKTWLGSAQLSANGASLVSPLGLYEYSTQQHPNADIRQLSTLPSLPSLRMNILHFPLRIFPYALRITEFGIPPITRMSLCPIVATSTLLKQSIATSYRTVNINSAWLL